MTENNKYLCARSSFLTCVTGHSVKAGGYKTEFDKQVDDIKLPDKENMFDIFYILRDRIFMFNCIKIDLPKNANEF